MIIGIVIKIKGNCSKKIIKDISIWMDEQNNLDKNLSNIEFIRLTWNIINKNNRITTQLDKIYQHEASSIPINKSIKDIKSIIIKEFEDFKIIVKGGDDYGKEINVLTKPHFYIKIDGVELKVYIPTLKDWKIKEFIASAEDYDFFNGMYDVYNDIIDYLKDLNNLKNIQSTWNDLNKNNKFLDKF